jgi:hypothetical protein
VLMFGSFMSSLGERLLAQAEVFKSVCAAFRPKAKA